MSTLNVSNITDGTDTVETSYVLNGSAKAWAMVNAEGTPSIEESNNISSITDTSNGNTTFTYSSGMSTATYGAYGTARRGNDQSVNPYITGYHLPTTSDVRFTVSTYAATEVDTTYISMSVLGDLA